MENLPMNDYESGNVDVRGVAANWNFQQLRVISLCSVILKAAFHILTVWKLNKHMPASGT